MKKIYSLIIFIISHFSVLSQSHVAWSTYEVTPSAQVNWYEGSASDKSGNTYTINFTQDPVNHYMTYRFFRYDTDGVRQWQYDNDSCFTNCNDKYNIVIPIDGDGAIFVGYYEDVSSIWQLRIKRIGINGNLLWENYQVLPYMAAYPLAAVLDHNNDLVINMRIIENVTMDEDFAFAKFEITNGSMIWHLEIPDGGSAIALDSANNIYSGGFGTGTSGAYNNYYLKINPAGTLEYQFIIHDNDSISPFNGSGIIKMITGTNNDLYILIKNFAQSLVQKYNADDGSFVFTKTLNHDSAATNPVDFLYSNQTIYALNHFNYFFPDSSFSGGHWTNKDYTVTAFTDDGVTIWEKTYFENMDSLFIQNGLGGATQILKCESNLFILSEIVTDSAATNFSLMLNKTDLNGNNVWHEEVPADFGPGEMGADTSCNIYISRSERFNQNYVATLTQKFSEEVTSVFENNTETHLFIYPNPVADMLHISGDIKNSFKITIINTIGEIVKQDINKNTVNVAGLASGIYFLKIEWAGSVLMQKFVRE